MLFEKPNLKRSISLDLVGIISIVVIVTVCATYCACVISGIVGGYDPAAKITVLDLVSGIAQVATAFAVVLAYIQFQKNRIQQRQVSISTEAKSQLEKMITVICEIETGEETSLKNLNKSITLLSNLAINFDELYKAMHEDIQKAIVRMQWQDMHFNYLVQVLIDICPVTILKKETSINENIIDSAAKEAREKSDAESVLPNFKKHVFIKELMNHPNIRAKFSLAGKINSLDTFVSYYLNSHNLNDLLYGLLVVRVDIRVSAPFLAVATPSKWATEKRA